MVVRGSRRAGVVMWAVLLCVGFAARLGSGPAPTPPEPDPPTAARSPGPGDAAPDDYKFSNGFSGTQGEHQWSYEQWDGAHYSPMSWDAATSQWHGSCEFCVIAREWLHPDVNDSVIVWT